MSLVPVAVLDWPAGPDTRAQWAGLVAGAGIEEEALEHHREEKGASVEKAQKNC